MALSSSLRLAAFAAAGALAVCFAAAEGPGDDAPPPLAIAARYQRRLLRRYSNSLNLVADSLALHLGVTSEFGIQSNWATKYDPNPPFSKYELELIDDSGGEARDWDGKWRYGCDDINVTHEERTVCAVQEIQALTALCEVTVEGDSYNQNISTMVAFLLAERGEILDSLGVKRAPVPGEEALEMWMCETAFPDSYEECPVVHAAAMLAVAQCGRASAPAEAAVASAAGGTEALVRLWFRALERRYAKDAWRQLSYDDNAIIWEALVLVAKTVDPGPLKDDIRSFVREFEAFLHEEFTRDATVWSPHGANAAAQRWSGEEDAALQEQLGRTVDDYVDRWKAAVQPGLHVNYSYTCDLVRGLAPLLEKRDRGDISELVALAIHLMEKDIEFNQIRFIHMLANDGPSSKAMQTRLSLSQVLTHRRILEGVFMRDKDHVVEHGRLSIRIDDEAHCVVALKRTMRIVEGLAIGDAEGDGEREHLQDGSLRKWAKAHSMKKAAASLTRHERMIAKTKVWRAEWEKTRGGNEETDEEEL